jgi:hypothetical protein
MVSTNDILLLGGGILAAIYLSKRSDQVATIAPTDYYQQVQAVDIQRLSEFGSRIEQLKDIRSQILGYEKGQAEQQISFIQSEIQKARQAGSEAQAAIIRLSPSQPKLGYSPTFFTKTYTGQALQNALTSLAQKAQQILRLEQSQEFITQAEAQQEEIRATYAELEQIV